MKIIICAGIPRSGSTWLYNAVRLIKRSAGANFGAGWIDEYDFNSSSSVHIIKAHEATDRFLGAETIVLTSRRDLKPIARSLVRMGWVHDNDDVLAALGRICDMHSFWNKQSHYEIAYEELKGNEALHIEAIARICRIPLARKDANEIAAEIDRLPEPERGGHDRETLLHPRHRGDRPNRPAPSLPPELLARIDNDFADWQKEWGYQSSRDGALSRVS